MAKIARVKPTSVYEFKSFGDFLAAYVKVRKRKERAFSFAVLARGLENRCAPTLLAMIARGERTPQPDLLLALCAYLGLSKGETEYAETLVGFQRAKSTDEKTRYSERLRLLKPLNDEVLLELDVYELIYKWHNIAILEMACLADFKGEAAWVVQRLGNAITVEQAQETLDLLVRLKLFVRGKDGRVKKSASGFVSPDNIPSQAIRAFHKQMFAKAQEAIETQPIDQRYFIGSTISIYKNKLELAAKLLEDFVETFKKQVAGDDGDEVYHIAFQFFRITEPLEASD